MKIRKFNENIELEYKDNFTLFDTKKSWEDYETLRNNVISNIRKIMAENGSDIIFNDDENVFRIINPNINDVQNVDISGIYENGNLKTEYDETIELYNIYVLSDLIMTLDWLERNKEYTYQYQKYVIENNPDEIDTITDKLNKKILKEHPHLGSGKDLNLL